MATNINAKSLGLFIVITLGLIFAVYTGNSVSDGQTTGAFIVIALLLFLVAIAGLGQRLYLLMLICIGLNGTVAVIPIPLTVRQIVEATASFFFISELILSRNKLGNKNSNRVDFWIWLNFGYLVTVFARNPVGFNFFGAGARVGGKPYVDIILAMMAFLILRRYKISATVASKLPLWLVSVAAFTTLAGLIGLISPNLGNVLGPYYSAFYTNGNGMEVSESAIYEMNNFGADRLTCLAPLGIALVIYIVSAVNPIELFAARNLRKLGLYALGIILILLSGFRSNIGQTLLQTFVAAAIREKFVGVVKIAFVAISIIIFGVLLSYTPLHMPFAVQRALSFLPGNWDQDAVTDARGSSDWRIEMWKTVLSSDKYIHNKSLGDGFGYLRVDYERSIDLMLGNTRLGETDMQQEMFMINGDVHSGPVSTIRCVGYLGLALFFHSLIFLARYVYKVIRECSSTPFQHFALYIGIPLLLFPFTFIFIFGDFKSDLALMIFSVGVFHMISNSVKAYKITLQKKAA